MADTPKPSVATIASDWWQRFCKVEGRSNAESPSNDGRARAFRAACRRLRSPIEAYSLDQTIALHRALAEAECVRGDLPDARVGLIAGLLGQVDRVETDSREKGFAAVRMGQGDPPTVSPMRFQKLVRSDRDAMMMPMRRVLAQIGFRCDPGQLAVDLFYWGDDVKARWCLQYYGDVQPPQTSTTAPEETTA